LATENTENTEKNRVARIRLPGATAERTLALELSFIPVRRRASFEEDLRHPVVINPGFITADVEYAAMKACGIAGMRRGAGPPARTQARSTLGVLWVLGGPYEHERRHPRLPGSLARPPQA